ncbi:MAG: helix-turn-helix domain-containing protein, partial [Deinococcus sp.]
MTHTHWTLAETLQRKGKKVPALARASGLSKNPVYDIVNGKTTAVALETPDKLLAGLEGLTGDTMHVE